MYRPLAPPAGQIFTVMTGLAPDTPLVDVGDAHRTVVASTTGN
jgi:hypothetical protein